MTAGLEYYASLLELRERLAGYRRAIEATVRPGDHVLDVGCGLGTYALMAARAGAARVTAVEMDPVAAALARELGVEREGGGRVRLLEADVTRIALDAPADVVIFEDFGGFGHCPGLRRLLERVRALARPGARYLPREVEFFLAPVDRPFAAAGPADAGELPFSAEALTLLRKRALNLPVGREFESAHLVGPGAPVGRLVLGSPMPAREVVSGVSRCARGGSITGLGGWVRLRLADGVSLDNSPSSPDRAWGMIGFPFEDPLPCREGEEVALSAEHVYGPGPDDLLWRWTLRGERGAREGTSVNALPGDLGLLRRGSPEYVPQPAPLAPLVARICGLVDGKNRTADIVKMVYDESAGLVVDERELLDIVMDIFGRLRGIIQK